jgi:hypothetical protein
MPRRYRRRHEDPEVAHDMAQVVKKIRARKKRMKKHAHEGEVARIFEGQRFSEKDIAMGPRNEGWQVIKSKFEKGPGGVTIEKTTRIRRFGRMKKTAFLRGFAEELEKKGFTLAELLLGAGVAGTGAAIGGGALYKHLTRKKKKKGQTKKASYLQKFAEGLRSKMVVEPTPKKSGVLEKNPFLRLQSKRRLVSGKGRTESVLPKAKGLLSGSAQFAHLTQRKKEAS